jgi:hypothetical protein
LFYDSESENEFYCFISGYLLGAFLLLVLAEKLEKLLNLLLEAF